MHLPGPQNPGVCHLYLAEACHLYIALTPLGRRMLTVEPYGPLQALLFHVALWRMNLAYFDRYALNSWPLSQVGVILWSLSASAHGWLPRETLTRLCTSPVIGVLEAQWDFGSSAMEARILRPLVWFGLLESRSEERSPTEVVDRRLYRKAPLFDRFVKFNVQVESPNISSLATSGLITAVAGQDASAASRYTRFSWRSQRRANPYVNHIETNAASASQIAPKSASDNSTTTISGALGSRAN